MPIQDFEIVGSYNNQRFPNIDAERTINMFEYIDQKGKKPKCLISTSGLENTNIDFTPATGGFRGQFVLNNFEYVVVGQYIFRIDSAGNAVALNGLGTLLVAGSGYVGIDANNNPNGEQILFVDGTRGYIWDTGTDEFTYDVQSIDPAFPSNPIDVCFIDGFLIVASGGTNTFGMSSLNDAYSWGLVANTFTADSTTDLITVGPTQYATGMKVRVTTTGTLPNPLVVNTDYYVIRVSSTTIRLATSFANAVAGTFINLTTNGTPTNTMTTFSLSGVPGQLQQGQINSHPGNIVACRTLHRRIFFFSENYTEVWENAGIGTNLPIRRNNALLMEYGTPAIASIVTGFDRMMFLSQDKDGLGSAMMVVGTESIPVSNRALDFQLAQYASLDQISDARGIFIKENGIIFYRLNFTKANHTFVYNVTISNPSTEEGKLWHEEQVLNGDRHPAQTHGYFNGNNYYGSYDEPILYQVDNSFTTNDGEIIERIRIGRPYVPATYNRTRIDRFMVDIVQGLTSVTNINNILELATENNILLLTENDFDILLETSSLEPVFSTDQGKVFLSISKNGGVSYGYEQVATVGAMGDRTHRTVWRKLGVIPRGQAFVPQIKFFFNTPFIILGAAWSFEVLPE